MKSKNGVTLVELIVWISITMLLMISIGIFVSSWLSNIFIQDKSLWNMFSINDFSNEIRKTTENLEKEVSIISSEKVIFKRKRNLDEWWFAFIWTFEKNDFCENWEKTKHIFIKNFIPFKIWWKLTNKVKVWDFTSDQKENKIFKNEDLIIWANSFSRENISEVSWEKVKLNWPTWLALYRNELYISDTLNNRILKMKKNWKVSEIMNQKAWLEEPTGLLFDWETLYIANSWKWEILKYQKKNYSPSYKIEFDLKTKTDFNKIKLTYIKNIVEDDENLFKIEKNEKNKILEKLKKSEIDDVEINENYKIFYKNQKWEEYSEVIKESEYKEKILDKNYIPKRIEKEIYFYTSKLTDNQEIDKQELILSESEKTLLEKETFKSGLDIGFVKQEKSFYERETKKTINPDWTEKKEKKLRKKIKKSTLDYIDFLSIKDNKFIKHKDGSFIEILEIVPLNLNNINPDFKQSLIDKNSNFYLSYSNDVKLIYINYPNDFSKQKQFLINKIEKEENKFKQYMLKLKLEEFEILENFKYKKSFFLLVFGNSEIDLIENIKRIKDTFPLKLEHTNKETKEKIYFKLNNLNSNF